jgi:hypothetical protein
MRVEEPAARTTPATFPERPDGIPATISKGPRSSFDV